MKIDKIKKVAIIAFLLCSFSLISCNNEGINIKENVEGIKLNKGAVVENIDSTYKNLNLNDERYEKLNEKKVILFFDYINGNYIFKEDGKFKAFFSGKEIELNSLDGSEEKYKLSPGGKYLLFFKNEPIKGAEDIMSYSPHVISLNDGKDVKIKNSATINGTCIDWLNEDELIYYGVGKDDNNITNGLFKYNIKNEKDEEIKEIKESFIQFLKSTDDGVVFLEEKLDNSKDLKLFDATNNLEVTLTDSLVTIFDVVKSNDCYYVLGSFKNDSLSLYEVKKEGEYHRLIYDFPSFVKEEKGLSIDEQGNVLVIGINEPDNIECIYKCSEDGSISKVLGTSKEQSEYIFVR
ncbi:MAG: hypothetical protein SOY42_06255 [Clostridium sp.]|nr:hypothetical protein [Clostridium sp.]